jgi:hypothetical protein
METVQPIHYRSFYILHEAAHFSLPFTSILWLILMRLMQRSFSLFHTLRANRLLHQVRRGISDREESVTGSSDGITKTELWFKIC